MRTNPVKSNEFALIIIGVFIFIMLYFFRSVAMFGYIYRHRLLFEGSRYKNWFTTW